MHVTHLITAVLFIALKSGPYFWSSEFGTWWMCTITAYMPHPKPQFLIRELGSYVNTQEIQFHIWWSYPNPCTVIQHSTDSNTIEMVLCIQSDMWSLAAIWPWSNIVFHLLFLKFQTVTADWLYREFSNRSRWRKCSWIENLFDIAGHWEISDEICILFALWFFWSIDVQWFAKYGIWQQWSPVWWFEW
jgi:hypothetical protein